MSCNNNNMKTQLDENSQTQSAKTFIGLTDQNARNTLGPHASQNMIETVPSINRITIQQTQNDKRGLKQQIRKQKQSERTQKHSIDKNRVASRDKKELINFDALMMDEDDQSAMRK